ncbi:MAG: chemotaxis protein CheA [Gemmatimonadetes bacterium]|nr:chemotaxis protein CheA [Gemmatimonadota bacterium]
MDPSRYADLFRTESREQLSALNRALLALEQGEAMREPVDAIFRGVHTIKGMSATMGYSAVAEFSHELESLLDKVRTGEQGLTAELMDALFAAADALEDGIEGAREDDALSPAMKRVLERLHDVAGGRATSEFRVARPSGVFGVTSEFTVPAPAAADAAPSLPAPVHAGPTATVRVVQAATTLLPGVRAFMVIQRLRGLGEITASVPTVEALQAATTPQRFEVRVATSAGSAELEQAVRSAGDVDEVTVVLSAMVQPAVVATDATVRTRSAPPFNRRAADASPTFGRRASDAIEAEDLTATAERAVAVPARTRHVRIELSRLDALLDLIGELVIVRGRLNALTRALALPALQEAMSDATRLISDLQTEIMTSRLVPVGQVFDRFPRLVRDIARQLGKDVLLQIEGKEIELDRSVLDEIAEPVVHLLRNAVDHGLEMPDVREAQGKPRAGRLTLAAQRDRSAVLVTVRDDGMGIDRERVLKRAIELGMVEASTTRLDDEAMLRCIAHAGFSTAEVVTDVSGRGVGVDAVQSRVRTLGGSIEVATASGVGTTMTIRLPVTLAIVRALLARVGDERYALPLTHVRETMERMPATIRRVQGREVLVLRDEVLPVLRLREVVHLPPGEESGLEEIVVIERGDRRAGLVVDELTGQEDIVVKSYDAVRDGTALFSGATILSDGAPALIVDVGSLL